VVFFQKVIEVSQPGLQRFGPMLEQLLSGGRDLVDPLVGAGIVRVPERSHQPIVFHPAECPVQIADIHIVVKQLPPVQGLHQVIAVLWLFGQQEQQAGL
jgi:hypothetical protein